MKSLRSKLLNFGTGIATTAATLLPMKNSYSQTSQQANDSLVRTEQVSAKKPWTFWIGTASLTPHDKDLKNAFGTYWGLNGEARMELEKKNLYIAPSYTYAWGIARSDNGSVLKANCNEFTGFLVYKMEDFEFAGGPTLSSLKMSLKEKIDNNGTITYNHISESFTGLGLSFRMMYFIPLGGKTKGFLLGEYTNMPKDEDDWPETIGTTKFGAGILF